MRMPILSLLDLWEFRFLSAFRAPIVHAVILYDLYLCRDKIQLPAHEFRADLFQRGTALTAYTFFFWDIKKELLNRQTL